MLAAGCCFAASHATELFLIGLGRATRPWSIIPGVFVVLAFMAVIQLLIFLPVGWLLALVPSRLAAARFRHARHPGRGYVLSAVTIGIVATPICAAVAWLPLNDPNSPTYVDRLGEYVAPMVLAGLAGGLAYRRCASRAAPVAKTVADVF